jgi:hypothetical protein
MECPTATEYRGLHEGAFAKSKISDSAFTWPSKTAAVLSACLGATSACFNTTQLGINPLTLVGAMHQEGSLHKRGDKSCVTIH